MSEITDAEAAEVLWASSEKGKAAVKAAREKARQLLIGSKYNMPASMAEIGAIVYAAYLAAGRDAGPDEPREHVHDWRVLKSEEVSNPPFGPSAFGWQTVALLRCAACGDIGSRVLAGEWTLEDLQATGEQR